MGCKARSYFREAVLKSSLRDGKESPIRKHIKNFSAKSGGSGLMFTMHFPDGAHLAPNPPRNSHLALLYHTDVRDPPSLPLAAHLPHAYSLHALQSMPSVRMFHLQGLILPSTVQLAKAFCSFRQLPTHQKTYILCHPLLNHLCGKNIESSPGSYLNTTL